MAKVDVYESKKGEMIQLSDINKCLKETGKYWLVFTGDSITSCEWVHPNWRDIVIYVLQEEMKKYLKGDWKTAEWGIKGFNFAYDGSTTKDILEKIENILLVKPQMVIGLMGENDSALGISVNESVENINKIAESVISSGSKLVWCNSISAGKDSRKNAEYESYAKALMQIPDKKGLIKVDMFNLYQKFPAERFFTFIYKNDEPDLEHPNQLGNAYIAKIILEKVLGINFDPEKYIQETFKGKKNPSY